jgi:head-tail adaptor
MRAGLLRHRLLYQEPLKIPNGLGQRATTGWTDIGELWGNVRAPSGREAIQAQSMKATISHVIEIRKPTFALLPKGRLIDSDGQGGLATYKIAAAIDVEGRNRMLTVFASQVVEQGDAA